MYRFIKKTSLVLALYPLLAFSQGIAAPPQVQTQIYSGYSGGYVQQPYVQQQPYFVQPQPTYVQPQPYIQPYYPYAPYYPYYPYYLNTNPFPDQQSQDELFKANQHPYPY